MKYTFNLSEFRTVEAQFDTTITIVVVDSRVKDNSYSAEGLTLAQYDERVEFFKKHDHVFGMNMAKEKFCR